MNQKEFEEYRKSQNFCHVYAAQVWHDDVYIVGDKKALQNIKRAIDKALNEEHGVCRLRPNDDETYLLHVVKVTNPKIEEKLCLPYRYDVAIGNTEGKIHPFQLIHNPELRGKL
jgi:hypothetical protein